MGQAILLLILCSVADRSSCHDQAIGTMDGLSMAACMIRGQQLAALYLREHPDEFLTGIRCAPADHPPVAHRAA